jgi:lipoprotein-releasing system permease protein
MFFTFGITAMIVVAGIMDGVQAFIRDQFRGTQADVTVYAHPVPRQHWRIVREALAGESVERGGPIVAMAPRMTVPAVIIPGKDPAPGAEDRLQGVQVVGIDPELERQVTPLDRSLDLVVDENLRVPASERASLLDTIDGVPGILLGDSLARDLGVSRSGRSLVTVLTGDPREERKDRIAGRPQVYRVVGCYSTGKPEYDKQVAYVRRDQLRSHRYVRPDLERDADAVHLRVDDPDRATETAHALARRHPFLVARSFEEENRIQLLVIQDQKGLMLIILSAVILVAGAAIVGIVYMTVVEKTRDIGILRSMGLSRRRLVAVFTVYGGLLGLIGSGLGLLLGLQCAAHLDGLVAALSDLFGVQLLNPDIYPFKEVPVRVDPGTVATIVLASLGMSFLAAFLPAFFKAGFLSPVRCLRND